MIQETLLQNTERVMGLVMALQAERDKALAELMVSRAEREQMVAMLAQIESNVAETLDTSDLTPEPADHELSREVDELHRALQETKAELERTKEDLARAEFKLRGQAAKLRRQSASTSGQD